jgi:anti-sigma B factor antagonist
MSQAQITTRYHAGTIRVSVRGEVDLTCADRLSEALRAAARLRPARRLVVDLDRVTFLDSTGIGALVAGRHEATAHRLAYQVINAHGIVARILTVSGVNPMLRAA